MNINIKRLSSTAIIPAKAHETDAGFDLYADETVLIPYGETKVVPTNIAIELPQGYMADVRPRSGLTLKTPLRVQYGTIDSGFQGSIGIICENTNKFNSVFDYRNPIVINEGDKIAQLVIQEIPRVTLTPVEEFNKSERGNNGFGSTGI